MPQTRRFTGGLIQNVMDPATIRWVGAVVANGGTVSSPRKFLVDSLIKGLQADGVWSLLDRLWLFTADNEPSALTDLVANDLAVSVNSTTFTANFGYTGNGSGAATMYVDTTYNPKTDGSRYVLESAHLSVWVLNTFENGGAWLGITDGTNFSDVSHFGDPFTRINSPGSDLLGAPNPFKFRGHILGSRIPNVATSRRDYKNGIEVANTSGFNASAIPSFNLHVLARNTSGSPNNYADGPVGCISMGSVMSATDALNFYNRLYTYMSSAMGFDPDTLVWVNAVIANGGTVSAARKRLVDNLIVGLKADGLWTKLDRLWLFAAENAGSALIDLVYNWTATVTGHAPSFTIDRGYAGDGSTTYIDTAFNPSSDGQQYTLNSASLHLWDNTSHASDATESMGANDGSGNFADIGVFSNFAADGFFLRMNTGTIKTLPGGASQGLGTGNRSSVSTEEAYHNGVSLGQVTSGADTIAIPSFKIFIGGTNNAGTFSNGTTDQFAAAAMGSSFNATQMANFYARLRTYMTAVGVP